MNSELETSKHICPVCLLVLRDGYLGIKWLSAMLDTCQLLFTYVPIISAIRLLEGEFASAG